MACGRFAIGSDRPDTVGDRRELDANGHALGSETPRAGQIIARRANDDRWRGDTPRHSAERHTTERGRLPVRKFTMSKMMPIANSTQAICDAIPATPEIPSTPAIRATTRNINA